MKPGISLAIFLLAGFSLAHADQAKLSAERLDMLDQRGYFTPSFKKAIRDLVDAREAVTQAHADEAKYKAALPDLQHQADTEKTEVAALRQQLLLYTHPENADFEALQAVMKNPNAKTQEKLALAQAFVWTYPTDPHQAEAGQYLQQVQQQIAAQQQAERDAEAARVAAHAKLLDRVRAKSLSLQEWKDFLRDMSQEEILGYLGRPEVQNSDYWTYTGDWTTDPVTQEKVGLQIDFNGTRAVSVAPAPHH